MKPASPSQYENFTAALRKVLTVSHSDMKAKLDAEKQAKQQQKKPPSASCRASGDKD